MAARYAARRVAFGWSLLHRPSAVTAVPLSPKYMFPACAHPPRSGAEQLEGTG